MGHPGSPYSPIPRTDLLALQHVEANREGLRMPLEQAMTAGY